jgi:hypothetical protein
LVLELKVLQAVRLKGLVSPDDLAATVDEADDAVAETVAALTQSGLLVVGKTVQLSPDGRARLAELLAAERSTFDADAVSAGYDAFRGINADFKALVTDWQLKDGEPNTHEDTDYDAAVLGRLDDIHARVIPIIRDVADHLPRLASYAAKLDRARQKIIRGESIWLTRPIIDSYHTVWFELHEELIVACGLTRQGEAEAGHAE